MKKRSYKQSLFITKLSDTNPVPLDGGGFRVGVFDSKFKKFPDSIIKNRSI